MSAAFGWFVLQAGAEDDGLLAHYRLDGGANPVITATYGFTVEGGTLIVGAHLPTDRFFAGDMDDVRIFNRVLTVEEIAALADRPVANVCPAVEIEWLSVPGIVCQVQWADTINSNTWYDLGCPILGQRGSTSVVDRVRARTKSFHRITSP